MGAKPSTAMGNEQHGPIRLSSVIQRSLLLVSFVAVASLGRAAVIWDENLLGDLSDDHFTPDSLTLTAGSNILIGNTGNYDRDYFHFSLAPGQALTSVILRDYVSLDDISFLAVQPGTFITEDPTSANVGNLLGWCFFGTPQVGTDLLPVMGSNAGSIGFTPPLTGSDYSWWLQQTGDPTSYVMEFNVVPEPSSMVATATFLGMVLRRRKARK